jgi:hypothetical protein
MRLLQLDKDGELSLTEFISGRVPPYAILSHTWGQDGSEVTYQDVMTGTGKGKHGYNKIILCGQQAAKIELSYFWVDTCCIDKTSSAELSEAINSMHCWYKEATICFTYLEDVLEKKEISKSSMTGVKWFSRGWTLQELIAPRNVEFYAGDWTFLGTRHNSCDELSSITGIHIEALQNQPVEAFSIAQRMSWASKRETTRAEDIAYCLLGLFNVNMPLLYGEGQEKAFVRLQEEIMKDSDDQSIFAWFQPSADPLALHGLLADSPADFASSGTFVPVRDLIKTNPFSITNGGLRITLPMTSLPKKHPPGDSKGHFRTGVLDCIAVSEDTKSTFWVAIRLYRLSAEGDQYGRVKVREVMFESPSWRYRCAHGTVYVRKQVNFQHAVEAIPQDESSHDNHHGWPKRWLSTWFGTVVDDIEVCLSIICGFNG